jgi:hypothetical protein
MSLTTSGSIKEYICIYKGRDRYGKERKRGRGEERKRGETWLSI